MQQGASVVTIIVGACAAFIALWCGILWLAATVSGWRRLAVRFASTAPFSGEITSFVTAGIRCANYSGVLHLGVSDWGVYLVPMRIYRPFHAPLLIPWGEIEAGVREGGRWAWRGVRMTFPSVPRTSITLYGRAVDRVLPYLDRGRPGSRGPS